MDEKRNYIDLRGDGRIVIFERVESGGKWYVRLNIKNTKGYKTLSCKTKNRSEAEREALNLYDDLSLKVLNGLRINSVTYGKVVAEWERYRTNSFGSAKKDGLVERVKTYSLEFFGDRKIEEIKERDLLQYWDWRKNNYRRVAPQEGTLNRERTSIKSVFKFAYDRGYIKDNLKIEKLKGKREIRRASFTDTEWRILTRAMKAWVDDGEKSGAARKRKLARDYFLILSNTGLRVGEARNLKWENLTSINVDGEDQIKLLITGKTGMREVICNKGCEIFFKRIYDLNSVDNSLREIRNVAANEFVFRNARTGSAVTSFRKSFNALLEFAGIDKSSNNEQRTIYSLRHFYATKRLKGGANVYMLARQMGTSVEMIEKFYAHVLPEDVARDMSKSNNQRSSGSNFSEIFKGIKNSTTLG